MHEKMNYKSRTVLGFDSESTYFVVVSIDIHSCLDATESPGVNQANKRVVVGILKVVRGKTIDEFCRIEHLPSPAVGHPANDLLKPWLIEDRCKFYR